MTRSQLIGLMVTDAVLKSRLDWKEYAAAVVDHYHDSVACEDRVVDFHVGGTADAAINASRLNTQTVRRILIGEISMRVDIEESLVAALPEEWRNRLLRRLLERQGLMMARLPAEPDDSLGQIRSSCVLMRKAATAVERVAPMLEDQVIDPQDAPHFVPALEALNAMMGAGVTLSAQITRVMAAMQAEAGQGRAH